MTALCTLIEEAVALEHLNIDSSNIDEIKKANKILEALVECQSKATLESLYWSYDAFEMDDFVEELLQVLGNGVF